MSQIGHEKREIYVEPLEIPVPRREEKNPHPVAVPERQPEPVVVPAR